MKDENLLPVSKLPHQARNSQINMVVFGLAELPQPKRWAGDLNRACACEPAHNAFGRKRKDADQAGVFRADAQVQLNFLKMANLRIP